MEWAIEMSEHEEDKGIRFVVERTKFIASLLTCGVLRSTEDEKRKGVNNLRQSETIVNIVDTRGT